MKNSVQTVTIVFFLNFLLVYISKNGLDTQEKIFDFLAKDYPSSVVQN